MVAGSCETPSSTRYSEIVFYVLTVVLSYSLYHLFANTQAGERFADKTRQALAFEQLRTQRTHIIVYAEGHFEIFETLSFVQMVLQLAPPVQEKLRAWLASIQASSKAGMTFPQRRLIKETWQHTPRGPRAAGESRLRVGAEGDSEHLHVHGAAHWHAACACLGAQGPLWTGPMRSPTCLRSAPQKPRGVRLVCDNLNTQGWAPSLRPSRAAQARAGLASGAPPYPQAWQLAQYRGDRA